MAHSETDVTQELLGIRAGDADAVDRLWAHVYGNLRKIAHRELARGPRDATLSTTDLVHEAYLKCVDVSRVDSRDQSHFFAVACRAMRHILIDRARRNRTQKRRGHDQQLPLENALVMAEQRSDELLALDEALEHLARHDERLERIVECRFFGGFTLEETAGILGISQRTAEREWQRARIYLYHRLQSQHEVTGG